MIEQFFLRSGQVSTALLVAGLVALWLLPGEPRSAAPIYAGLLLLMVTPITRVTVACARYLRAGDRQSAALTFAILVVVALSGWAAMR